jgi:hypothetical protein
MSSWQEYEIKQFLVSSHVLWRLACLWARTYVSLATALLILQNVVMCQDAWQKFSNFVWGGWDMCCQHPRFTGFCAHFYNMNFVMEQEVLMRWYSSVSRVARLCSVYGWGSISPHQTGVMLTFVDAFMEVQIVWNTDIFWSAEQITPFKWVFTYELRRPSYLHNLRHFRLSCTQRHFRVLYWRSHVTGMLYACDMRWQHLCTYRWMADYSLKEWDFVGLFTVLLEVLDNRNFASWGYHSPLHLLNQVF